MPIFSVSCSKIQVNFAAIGEKELLFPEGKLMTKHQTLDHGYEYEVFVKSS